MSKDMYSYASFPELEAGGSMATLTDIHGYVRKITEIMASVLDMQVLICDAGRLTLADSDPTSRSEFKSHIGPNSILPKAMAEGQLLLLPDKENFSGCRACHKRENCDVLTIIAYPIIKNRTTYGCIGIYASTPHTRERLLKKQKFYIGFIANMADLLLSKLDEHVESLEIKAYARRQALMVESIDQALLSMDETYRIIDCNTKLYQLFGLDPGKGPVQLGFLQEDAQLKAWVDDAGCVASLASCRLSAAGSQSHSRPELQAAAQNRQPENPRSRLPETADPAAAREGQPTQRQFTIHINGEAVEVQVELCPIQVEGVFKGVILYFRKVAELYATVNKIAYHPTSTCFNDIIGESQAIRALKEDLKQLSASRSTMLIQGESGTGKDIFARAAHNNSPYRKGPFVSVNCAAIPENLLESEFFGYTGGAFTGSSRQGRVGKFELADGGTLFLDEIGELPLYLQPKLLRAIQDKKFQRVGSNQDIKVDLRIIAATNRDLEKMMEAGEFREDLFYRLNVIPICIPPLRKRRDDIQPLLFYFLRHYGQTLGKDIQGFTKETLAFLKDYSWPGNVRELQNAVEYAVNMARQNTIQLSDLPRKLRQEPGSPLEIRPLEEIEEFYIREALRQYGSNLEGKEKAAQALGMSRSTLYRKIKERQIEGIR